MVQLDSAYLWIWQVARDLCHNIAIPPQPVLKSDVSVNLLSTTPKALNSECSSSSSWSW